MTLLIDVSFGWFVAYSLTGLLALSSSPLLRIIHCISAPRLPPPPIPLFSHHQIRSTSASPQPQVSIAEASYSLKTPTLFKRMSNNKK